VGWWALILTRSSIPVFKNQNTRALKMPFPTNFSLRPLLALNASRHSNIHIMRHLRLPHQLFSEINCRFRQIIIVPVFIPLKSVGASRATNSIVNVAGGYTDGKRVAGPGKPSRGRHVRSLRSGKNQPCGHHKKMRRPKFLAKPLYSRVFFWETFTSVIVNKL